jgi:ribosomal protein L11 methyltransferase
MGFGTGHHATTRLCLEALQELDLGSKTVLDVGTGSGILAITAARLGAASAFGIDIDPDAVQSARENLACNSAARGVCFEVADVGSLPLQERDVVTANLTGALLVRSAPLLLAATKGGGSLVLSGLLAHERDEVVAAFGPASVAWERQEDEWVGLVVKKATGPPTRTEGR